VKTKAKRASKASAKPTSPKLPKKLEELTDEELAIRALEGYGDGPIAYAALVTLSAELDLLSDSVDSNDALKEALFAMSNRARIAAELDRRQAKKAEASS
jgi:hypothetical protein